VIRWLLLSLSLVPLACSSCRPLPTPTPIPEPVLPPWPTLARPPPRRRTGTSAKSPVPISVPSGAQRAPLHLPAHPAKTSAPVIAPRAQRG
jgi:hypothetical protein